MPKQNATAIHKNLYIQALRGFAISAVVLIHSLPPQSRMGTHFATISELWRSLIPVPFRLSNPQEQVSQYR